MKGRKRASGAFAGAKRGGRDGLALLSAFVVALWSIALERRQQRKAVTPAALGAGECA